MGILKEGTWNLVSKQDPRWNKTGRGMVGGGVQPGACAYTITELTKRFGDPPEDLEWSYMKD